MTSDEYRAILAGLQLGHAAKRTAALLGISVRHSIRYASGYPIPEKIAMLLRAYQRQGLREFLATSDS